MQENSEDYKIIVDNVYKTFNVYLDRANTIKEKLLFFKSRNRKEKREVLKCINLKIKKGVSYEDLFEGSYIECWACGAGRSEPGEDSALCDSA